MDGLMDGWSVGCEVVVIQGRASASVWHEYGLLGRRCWQNSS